MWSNWIWSKQSNLNVAAEVAKVVGGIDVFISNAAIADNYMTVLEADEEVGLAIGKQMKYVPVSGILSSSYKREREADYIYRQSCEFYWRLF